MATLKAQIKHLQGIPLFSGCSSKELEHVARVTDEVKVPAGKVIVDQGQMGREAFVLLEGTATVRRNGKKVASLDRGAVIGELSLLDHGPRTASVVADTDATLLVISQRNLYGVISKMPAIAHKLLANLASKVRDLDRAYYG